ncbi:YqjF family protein [Synoicihabitans lomoniglobus]|uniref:DUF2071 domain-containing protein n=1 Tax=Synoicihabitans lomoniglobus TaxID=2909285 RepID=A0AAF0CPG5_9BACT|nr:DUF2071 domain-containing protein [Opitutaceae bacterium LMO-M01]WED64624.1 DUF2071 domain-containing protein [Opitutaceae bacterium LMO-M01]
MTLSPPNLDQRLAARDRPASSPVMYQRWQDLLFLHWRWDPAAIQATLPAGLTVDTFEGDAWVGIVPFWMRAVRPRFLPPLPGLSWFQELNLRTYVHDARGRPGVWFYALDCNQPLAVILARSLFGLNYVHARQTGCLPTSHRPAEFHSLRRATGGVSHFRYESVGATRTAAPGSLEFFLVERYRLFAQRRGRLWSGRVWHPPYAISAVDVDQAETALWVDHGFPSPDRPADHAVMSSGVNVSVYPLQPV